MRAGLLGHTYRPCKGRPRLSPSTETRYDHSLRYQRFGQHDRPVADCQNSHGIVNHGGGLLVATLGDEAAGAGVYLCHVAIIIIEAGEE